VQEAFAVQCLADSRLAGLSDERMDAKVNINGSGISLGHPIGATGTMRLTTLLSEMQRSDARFALETICGGGGQGYVWLSNVNRVNSKRHAHLKVRTT